MLRHTVFSNMWHNKSNTFYEGDEGDEGGESDKTALSHMVMQTCHFTLLREGIREGHQGASGGISDPKHHSGRASAPKHVFTKPAFQGASARPSLTLLKF